MDVFIVCGYPKDSIQAVNFMDSKRLEALDEAVRSSYTNIAGIVVAKEGERILENYYNGYSFGNSVHVFSVTKSVFSALIGIAIDKGFIKSIDQKVLEFFPGFAVMEGEGTIRNISIRNLLTMTAPYKYQTEPYEAFFASPNPVADALDLLGGKGPIGDFNYSAIGGTQLLSGILSTAIGGSTFDFARDCLFGPLDIEVPKSLILRSREDHIAVMGDMNASGWAADPQGRNWASWGLFLRPSDMAKLGELYLNEGAWRGQQIVPRWWVDESTREHSRCAQWGDLAYGYLWWVIDGDSFAALGDGGNVIYVNSRKRLVIAIASLFMENSRDRIELIKKHIEPAID
jgi:Beta-lactamase class C and other penicillin binding proteins